MDIALVNGIRPMPGSGDGITEYAYNMYLQLSRKNRVKQVYSISRSKKNDISGLLKINSELSAKVRNAVHMSPDIVHIVNQEVGFAAAVSKSSNKKTPVITTIHDVSRFGKGLHRGLMQRAYNAMVQRSILQAVIRSDFIIFDSSQTMLEARKLFDLGDHSVVNIGISKRYSIPITAKKRNTFTVGYIGSFAYHKNVIMLLRAAKAMGNSGTKFLIYGVGNEARTLSAYKQNHSLSWVNLSGFAKESKKIAIYDNFDVLVFPSLYEGFGLPILEAQARGLPVIVYKYGKIPKEVKRFCLEAKDEFEMAHLIGDIKLNGYNKALRSRSMAYARSFTWEKCTKETMNAYTMAREGIQ
jgi:glycosyltransferase involved in cell wall biosynthesis